MPAEVLLIGNPHRRRKGKKHRAKSRRRASAKQRANWARFAARARARSHGGHKRRRRHAAVRHAANPIRHRRHHHAAAHHRRHRRRSNPIGFGRMRAVVPMLRSAGMGAVGAVVNDVAYGYAAPFLPAMAATPVSASGGINPVYYGGKLGMAFLIMLATHKFLRGKAVEMCEGALTVTLRDALKQAIVSFGVPLPMGAALNPGRVIPPLPISQNLRRYVGPTPARGGGVGLYVVGAGQSTGAREMMTR
jgi:hypothetical protein